MREVGSFVHYCSNLWFRVGSSSNGLGTRLGLEYLNLTPIGMVNKRVDLFIALSKD